MKSRTLLRSWIHPFALSLAFAAVPPIVFEDFEGGPLRWQQKKSPPKGKPEYLIEVEGENHFLRGAPPKGAEGKIIYKRQVIDLKKTPLLHWKWRALVLPEGGDEGGKGKNDSAAGVYVYLQKGPLRRILKYCWSSSHTGKEWITAPNPSWFWKTRMKVLRTGPPLGQWVEETVDLAKDFKEAFGDDAIDRAEGIGVLSDGDQTKSLSSADYDDFVLLPAGS